jgi:HD superfamily phosphohydrolase
VQVVLSDVDVEVANLIRLTGKRESVVRKAKAEKNDDWAHITEALNDHQHILALGEKHTRQKAIQDPVHGAILLEPWELDLISCWEMLRLRYVKQLGPAHIVYPGATHTRFEHCIGTNYLAQKCIRVVNYCEDMNNPCFQPLSQLLDEDHQRVFRAAALLHDVGHPPTSHTIEFALESWVGLSHTDLGMFLVLHTDLADILQQNGIDPKSVVDVFKSRSNDPIMKLLSEFIDSPLDIDKTDYLIRDAHFSGVELGIFPAERVLLTNRVVRDRKGYYHRAFMLKALHSLEALVLSRSWMFADLYLHHAVRVAEALTSKATYFRLKEEGLTKNECIGLFTRMTDGDLFRWLEQSATPFVREYAARIRYRRLFKVILAKPIALFEDESQERLMYLIQNIEKLIETELLILDDPGQVIIDVVNPVLSEKLLSQIPIIIGGDNGFDLVSLAGTEEGGPLLQALSQQKRTMPAVRVYADPKNAEVVRRKFEQMFNYRKRESYRDDQFDFSEY